MTQRMQSKMENSKQKWERGNKIQFPIPILYPVLILFPITKNGVVTLIHMSKFSYWYRNIKFLIKVAFTYGRKKFF